MYGYGFGYNARSKVSGDFNPLDLSPVFWFDYSTYSAGTLSGESDVTGNHTVTSVNGITVASDGTNNALKCDSADDEAATYGNTFSSVINAPHTFVVAYKPTIVSQPFDCIFGTQPDASTNSWGLFHISQKLRIFFRIGGSPNIFDTSNNVIADTNYKLIIYRAKQSEVNIRINGVSVSLSATSFSDTLANLDLSAENMYVGARNNRGSVNAGVDGFIGDHLLFDSYLSDSEVLQLENFFM